MGEVTTELRRLFLFFVLRPLDFALPRHFHPASALLTSFLVFGYSGIQQKPNYWH
jgi:hypothetical protein